MTSLFPLDRKITDVLGRGRFTLSAEVIPPRNGAELGKVLTQIETLVRAGAEFLSVTKGAGGSLRSGSLPIAQVIKERFGVPVVAHFTCRDLLPEEVENQLVDHHYFGIRNVLALRGDPPTDAPNWTPKAGSHSYAHQLISQVRGLNQGEFITRKSDQPKNSALAQTDFSIGCAAYPEHPDAEERFRFLKIKQDAGAEYAITQMVFDSEVYARFRDECVKRGITLPILPGARMLKSQDHAQSVAKRFGVSSGTLAWNGAESFKTLIREFKKEGAPGVHLFVMNDTQTCAEVLSELRISI